MTSVPSIGKPSVRQQAQQELEQEFAKKAVEKLKTKLRELHLAKVTVANIEREIQDLEAAVQQGNI